MKPYHLKWTEGNSKLNKDNGGVYTIVGFGIPADYDFVDDKMQKHNTCPGALACAAVCYAKQGMYRFANVQNARKANLDASLLHDFSDKAIADLKRMRKINVVRIHDSGDFYNQQYLDKWFVIAKALPDLTFYAYCKVLTLDFSGKPDNMKIVQSFGGKHDDLVNLNMPHSRIFSDDESRIKAGYIDGNVNDVPAIEGVVNIGLVYHGQKNLTPAQKRYFS